MGACVSSPGVAYEPLESVRSQLSYASLVFVRFSPVAVGKPMPCKYMCKCPSPARWKMFNAVGFMTETGEVLIITSAPEHEAGSEQSTPMVRRVTLDALLSETGVVEAAIAPSMPMFSFTEVQNVKAWVSKALEVPSDPSNRVLIHCANARQAHVPKLVADMLVTAGRLIRRGDAYHGTRGAWILPPLKFIQLPHEQHYSHAVGTMYVPHQGTATPLEQRSPSLHPTTSSSHPAAPTTPSHVKLPVPSTPSEVQQASAEPSSEDDSYQLDTETSRDVGCGNKAITAGQGQHKEGVVVDRLLSKTPPLPIAEQDDKSSKDMPHLSFIGAKSWGIASALSAFWGRSHVAERSAPASFRPAQPVH